MSIPEPPLPSLQLFQHFVILLLYQATQTRLAHPRIAVAVIGVGLKVYLLPGFGDHAVEFQFVPGEAQSVDLRVLGLLADVAEGSIPGPLCLLGDGTLLELLLLAKFQLFNDVFGELPAVGVYFEGADVFGGQQSLGDGYLDPSHLVLEGCFVVDLHELQKTFEGVIILLEAQLSQLHKGCLELMKLHLLSILGTLLEGGHRLCHPESSVPRQPELLAEEHKFVESQHLHIMPDLVEGVGLVDECLLAEVAKDQLEDVIQLRGRKAGGGTIGLSLDRTVLAGLQQGEGLRRGELSAGWFPGHGHGRPIKLQGIGDENQMRCYGWLILQSDPLGYIHQAKNLLMQRKTSRVLEANIYRVPKPSANLKRNYQKLIIVMIISIIFIAAELVGGVLSHSISVISDSIHLVTDLVGFVISFIALSFSARKSNKMKSFGFHRIEIIGVLANLFIIWSLTLVVLVEATERIIEKAVVNNPEVMLIVAAGGLAVNIVMYFVLHTGSGGHSHFGKKCEGHGEEGHSHSHHGHEHEHKHLHTHAHSHSLKEKHVHKHTEGKEQHHHDHTHNEEGHHHHHGEGCHHEEGPNAKKVDETMNEPLLAQFIDEASTDIVEIPKPESKQLINASVVAPTTKVTRRLQSKCSVERTEPPGKAHQNMSMKAAILHAITDIIQSVGLLIAALLIFFFGSDHGAPVTEYNYWHLLDPLVTFLFSILVFVSTFPITKECYNIILESTPYDFDHENIYEKFEDTQGIIDIHDFHVWSLKPGSILLSAHVFTQEGEEKGVLHRLTDVCREYNIFHSTIQVEGGNRGVMCENDIH